MRWKTAGGGGAICFFGATNGITVNNSNFHQNSMNISGVGCYAWGGAIAFLNEANQDNKNIYIINSNFTENWVYATNTLTKPADYSRYSEKQVTSYGGAVYFKNPQDNINIEGSKIDSNHALLGVFGNSMTGAIYFGGSSLTNINIKDTEFTNNTANNDYPVLTFLVPVDNCNFTNVIFKDNNGTTAPLYFGNDVKNTNVFNCTFKDNENSATTNSNGGGIYVQQATSLNIEGSTFDHNTVKNNGGALYVNSGSGVSVNNCTFTNHHVDTYGGAIYWADGDFITNNSRFINNSAAEGPNIYFAGETNVTSFYNTVFINSTTTAGDGGAVSIPASANTKNVTFYKCTFDNNNANSTNSNGGAIAISSGSTFINITGSNFTNNGADNGGAIYLNEANATISGSTFSNNHATDDEKGNDILLTNNAKVTEISGSEFKGTNNIYNDGGEVTLKNNEQNSDGTGYFIENKGSLSLEGNTFKSVVINNGGISSHVFINISGNTTHTCDDYIFYLNATITDNEGNIIISPTLTYSTYDNPTIEAADNETHDANFTTLFNEHKTYLVTASDPNLPDRTVGISIVNVILREGTYTWLQDKMDNLVGNDLDLNVNVTFDPYYDLSVHNTYHDSVNFTTGMRYNKTINFNGNGFTISGLNQARIFYITVRGVNITDTAFENANSTDNGGALYLSSLSGNIYINDCNFTNNNAKAGGAIYYVPSGNVKNITIENCRFENNNAFGDQTVDIIDDKNHTKGNGVGCGGALHLNGENHKLIGNEFISNNVKGNKAYGGALYLAGSGHSLLNNNFTGNGADNSESNGGAVYSYANSVNITNNRFIDNHARVWGGAFVDGYGTSTLKIENSTFTGNTAKNAGAVDLYETPYATINNCLFDDNRASNKAGALYMNGLNGVVSYCNFTNNKANYSSAISYTPDDPSFVDPTKANITHCNFINNIADVTGTVRFDSCEGNINYCNFTNNTAASAGAIYVCMKDVTIEHCNFNGNNATNGNGGAIWTDSSYDNTSIRYCEFTNNRASGDGAAVYLANKDDKLSNCDFTSNVAAGNGGAIYTTCENVNVSDSTFSKNTADNGGAIYYQNSGNNLCIYNDTFTENIAEFNGGAVYYNALRDYNDFDGNAIPVDATSKRVSWDDAGKQVIFTSLFENNKDYLMNASAIVTNTVTINVAVPKGVSGYTINITVSNGTVVTVTKTDGQPSEVDGHTVIPVYLTGLEDGKYNATVGFRQGDVYLYKEAKVQFTVGNPTEGAFTTLQKLIDDALEQARTSANPAVVDLTEAVIYTQGKDNGQINITGPITINGHNLVIDALGLSRIFDIRSEGVILNDILFKGGNASGADSTSADKVNGDAILWEGANGVINNCKFEDHAGSSTVYVLNSNNFLVNDTEFKDNNCSPISVSSSNGTIANSTFTDNTGEMIIAGDSLVTVSASTFESTGISVNSGEKVTLYNITLTNSNVGISSDVEMEDIRATSSAVDFNDGNSSVVASSFSGANPITVAAAAEVHLTKVNTTAETSGASVLNKGTLYLNGNKFGNVIDNVNGQIKSSTTVWVLNNSTVIYKAGTNIQLNASIVDDSNNTIKVDNLIFTLNGVSAGSGQLQDNGIYTRMYTTVKGVYVVSVNDTSNNDFGLTNSVYKNGILKVKVDPADVGELTLNITQKNQIVTIKAIFADDETGNVTFVIKGTATGELINKTIEINETTHVATLTLSHLLPDDYVVNATYMGDDTHFKGTPQVDSFTVLRQASNIAIKVNDSLCGQDAIAVITTNATGNVTIIFGDQIKKVEITNGKYEWNLSNSLAPRFYTISAYFEANKFADSSFTSSNFTVYNYTVDVTVSETQFNQSANITVTIAPQQAIGIQPPVIRLDGEIIPIAFSQNGVYIATTDKITKTGQHTVNVTYAGNGTLFYPKEIIETFNVSATDAYEFNVEITEKPYGENTTIVVTGPEGANVTVNVDGVNYTVTVGDDGKGNLTLNNLTAGPHHIVANFTGDENHTGKSVVKDITVPKQTPDIQVIVPENITPGSPANVTVVVGKNATGTVIVTIDNVPTMVEVTNGTVTVPIPTDKPGAHNITVQYAGDDNYANPGTVTKANYTVYKYDAEIDIKEPIVNPDNSVVVVVEMVPANATGNVTVSLANGTNFTVPLKDGKAEIPVGVLPVNSTMAYNVTYSGDENYNKTTKVASENLTVERLNNFDVNVTIKEGQYGENTTVVVAVTPGVGGNVSVVVDNVSYLVTQDASGNYVAVIPPLPVGDHNVTVKFENSSNYADKVVNKNYTVEKNDHYPFDVDVTPAPFGGDTVINVTGPAGTNVTVTVDGVNYTVTVGDDGKGNLTLNNLTAGPHKVTANFTGDDNHTGKAVSEEFSVPKQTPDIQVIVPENIAPGSTANVTVVVGKNATGTVVVTIDNVPTMVEVKNGTAVVPIPTDKPGAHNITVQFSGDDNYAVPGTVTKANYTVNKLDAEIDIKEPIVNPDNSVVVVVEMVPGDATGNVTVTLANGTNFTVALKDGKAEIPVGVLPVNSTMAYNVTYSGDENYNKTTKVSANNLTVERLNNFDVNVTINEGQAGENTTVVVSVTPGVGGNVSVVVDNVSYLVNQDASGNYVAIIPPLPVGNHNVTVKFENSSNYADKVVNKNYTVEKNDHYPFDVDVTPAPFGGDTVINVTGPAGTNVTVTVDGVNYTVTVGDDGKGNLTLNNLTAGPHKVTANFTGDDNHTGKAVSEEFNVPKQTPDIQVIVPENIAPGSTANVTVVVGKNATGTVIVTIDNVPTMVKVTNGTVTVPIPTDKPGAHNITVQYAGDDNYAAPGNVTKANYTVNKLDAEIDIKEPVVNPDNSVVVVVEMVPGDATGNVTVSLANGTNFTVALKDGKAEIPVGVLPVNSTMAYNVTYSGDENYNKTTKVSAENLTVGRLNNFDVNVTINEGQAGENTTVVVSVTPGVGGNVSVVVDNVSYLVNQDASGNYVAIIPPLPVGDHNVTVKFENSSNYADKVVNKNYTVEKNSHYDVNITIIPDPTQFGNQTIIDVTGPVGTNITVDVDGVNYTVTINQTGHGQIVLDNLTVGSHKVIANFTGNDNFTGKVVEKIFDVGKSVPEIQVIVPENITAGSPANVTVVVGKNATGNVIITIDNVPTMVEVKNGTAVVHIPTNKPGIHNITVQYAGDDNYAAPSTVTKANYTVDKLDAEIDIKEPIVNPDNSVVVVVEMVPANATGNVTVSLANGTNITVALKDGKAEIPVGVLPVNSTMAYNVTYSGDENYNKTTKVSAENLTVGRLNNFDVNVTINEGQAGENTTVVVSVTPGVGGNVSVVVDNVSYLVNQDASGNYVAIIPPLPVGDHNVTVKFENSSNYADKVINKNYTVEKNDHYPFDVDVTPAPFGGDTVINVTGPAGTNVTVTVDGVNYTVTVGDDGKGNLTLNNLTAGPHEVTINFAGDDNHTGKSVSEKFDVPKKTPDIQVIVPDNIAPGSPANVTVVVGDNATGTVVVTIDNVPTMVEVKNGTAVVPIPTDKPGAHNITVQFSGDDNYAVPGTVTKANYTVERRGAEIDIKEPIVNPDNSVVVVVEMVPGDATGNVTVSLANGTNFTVALKDGKAEIPVGVLPVNSTMAYNVTYSGDENYNRTTKASAENLTVGRLNNFDVNVTINEGQAGENTTVVVSVTPGVGGNVSVVVDNVSYLVNQDASGNYVAIIPPLPVGDHNVTVKFENSSNYADKVINKNYTVEKNDHYPFDVDVTPAPFGGDTVINVTGPAGTNVTVTVDGVNYTVTVGDDGKGNLTLNNLTAGPHKVTANFTGDDNHTGKSVSEEFNVPKQTPDIQVTVTPSAPIAPGSDVNVTISVGNNATGTVIVTVDGVPTTVEVKNGTAVLPISAAQPGEHNITVKYVGDDNYAAPTTVTQANFTVETYEPSVEVIGVERDENNTVTVSVKVNGTGNVTVKVGDKTYNATVEDGVAKVNIGDVPVGSQDINITYSGDENFAGKTIIEHIDAPLLKNYNLTIDKNDIKYGEVAQVNVTLPADADPSNVKVYVDGEPVNASDLKVTGNVVQLNADGLNAGDHTVEVVYEGDGKYDRLSNSTKITVDKADIANPEINITSPVDVGQPVEITVKLPSDANGTITVNVNGTKYTYDLVNGSVNISIPNLGNGTYDINVTYSGDDNYDPITVSEKVTVEKIVPSVIANTSDITVGQNAVIEVTLPDDATGNVTIKIGDIEQTTPVHGGVNQISVSGVPVGENKEVTVTYNGNSKYTPNTNRTILTVNPKPTSADDVKIIDNGDGTITVIVPDNATGNITVKIGNETLPAVNLTDGKAVINLTNSSAKPGTQNITVTYSGDENHTSVEVNSTGVIPKWDSNVNATVSKIREGDDALITVEVTPKGATGKVYADVNGTTYSAEIDKDGKAVITVPGLKEGTQNITVTYSGDDNYQGFTTQTQVVVEEPITVEVNGTGEDSQVIINLPKNATQNVTAYIDGNEVLVVDQNGTPSVNLSDVPPGKHNITVVYVDDNNNTSIMTTEIYVPKWPSTIEASAPTIREGDLLPVTVTGGSSEMDGLVLVDVNGTGYYANLTGGKAIIQVPGLKEGTYDANITYLGDGKYDVSNNTFKVTVESPIIIDVDGAGNSTQILVDLPNNGTDGNVTVLVDGKEVPVKVENGTAIADLNNITAGDHNVTVIYKDKAGTESVVNTTIKVYNSIKANDMKRGWMSPYDYEAEFLDKNGRVLADIEMEFKVDGTTYKVKTDNKGIAKLNASHLAVGEYTVEITNTLTHEVLNKSVTIVERLINNKDITMDFVDGTSYTVTAIGDDGNPVGKGEVVGIKVNDRSYIATTDANGVAKLKINLNPAKYTITAEYAKYKVSNKLVVKQTLKLVKKTVTVKKSAKSFKLKATLKWTSGKAIKGKQIVFKFQGKTYKAKTNSKGLAQVTIKQSVIKKLKAGKKYTYSAAYKTNKVNGKVKVSK